MPQATLVAFFEAAGATAADAAVYAEVAQVVITVATTYATRETARRAESAAKDAYNASLRDRYVMVRGAVEPRQMVLGRCRVSGPVTFIQSYGPNQEYLVFCVALAAHQIDAIETIYFNDQPLTLDTYGNVIGAQTLETFSIAATSASFTLNPPSNTLPNWTTLTAQAVYGTTIVPLTTSGSGISLTVSGALAGQTGVLQVFY